MENIILTVNDEIIVKYLLIENSFVFKVFLKQNGEYLDITKSFFEIEGVKLYNNKMGVPHFSQIKNGEYITCSFGSGNPDGLILDILLKEFYGQIPNNPVFGINVKEEQEFRKKGNIPSWSWDDGNDWNLL